MKGLARLQKLARPPLSTHPPGLNNLFEPGVHLSGVLTPVMAVQHRLILSTPNSCFFFANLCEQLYFDIDLRGPSSLGWTTILHY